MKNIIANMIGKIEAKKSFDNYQRLAKKGYYPAEKDSFDLSYDNDTEIDDKIDSEQVINDISSNCSSEATPVVNLRGSENDILVDLKESNTADEIKDQEQEIDTSTQNEPNPEESETNETSNQVNSDNGDHTEAASTQIPRVDDEERKFDGYPHFDSLIEENSNGESYMNVDLNGIAMSLGSAEGPYGGQELQDRINGYVNPTHSNQHTASQQPDAQRYDYSAYYSGMPTQPGYGRHKQDNQEVKQPKIEVKAKPDIIEGVDQAKDTVEGALNALGVEKREVKQDVAIFKDSQITKDQENLQQANTGNRINYKQTIQAGNESLINKYWWLKEIQRIANKNNCLIQFTDFIQDDHPIGIMQVFGFTEDRNNNLYVYNPYKSFIIDYSGNFYDKRIKLFALANGSYITNLSAITYDKLKAYSVLLDIRNDKNTEKNLKINEKFFDEFFKGGSTMLNNDEGMYNSDLRELNTYVDIATTPTKYMNKEDRNNVRDRLIKTLKIKAEKNINSDLKSLNPFVYARSIDNNCRFRYYGFDRDSKVFMLENMNPQIPIYAIFSENNCDIILNPQEAIEKYELYKSEYRKEKGINNNNKHYKNK